MVFELVFLAWSWSPKLFLSLPCILVSSFRLPLKCGCFPTPSDGTWLVQHGAWEPRDSHPPPIRSALSPAPGIPTPAEMSLLQSFPSPLPEGQLFRLVGEEQTFLSHRALSSRPGS